MNNRIVIAIGKFSIYHYGHDLVINRLKMVSKNLNAIPHLVIIDPIKLTKDKPLTGKEKLSFIQEVYPNLPIEISKNAYTTLEMYKKQNFNLIGIVTGEDRIQSYTGLVNRFYKNPNIRIIGIPRNENDEIGKISSSKIRKAILDNNYELFKSYAISNSYDNFNFLKARISSLENG